MRRLLLFALVVVGLVASAAAALASPPPSNGKAGYTLSYTATLKQGSLTRTWHGSNLPLGQKEAGPLGSSSTIQPESAFPGCMSVFNVIKEHAYDPIFGYTYWVYHEDLRWCWGFGAITSFDTTVYFSDVGTGWVNAKPNNAFLAYWYTWNGNVKGGRYVYRQGKIDECAAILCAWTTGSMYPYIKLWVNAGPLYAWTGDVNS